MHVTASVQTSQENATSNSVGESDKQTRNKHKKMGTFAADILRFFALTIPVCFRPGRFLCLTVHTNTMEDASVELERLQDVFECGFITEEEYRRRRKRLLNEADDCSDNKEEEAEEEQEGEHEGTEEQPDSSDTNNNSAAQKVYRTYK